MKKPEIDIQSKRMMVETKAYSEMIDALIDAYYLVDADGGTKQEKATKESIVKALKKAGVEL